jgi:hypothetical protein
MPVDASPIQTGDSGNDLIVERAAHNSLAQRIAMPSMSHHQVAAVFEETSALSSSRPGPYS